MPLTDACGRPFWVHTPKEVLALVNELGGPAADVGVYVETGPFVTELWLTDENGGCPLNNARMISIESEITPIMIGAFAIPDNQLDECLAQDITEPNGQPRRKLDTSKAKERFGFESKTSFKDGLRETIDWYLKNNS